MPIREIRSAVMELIVVFNTKFRQNLHTVLLYFLTFQFQSNLLLEGFQLACRSSFFAPIEIILCLISFLSLGSIVCLFSFLEQRHLKVEDAEKMQLAALSPILRPLTTLNISTTLSLSHLDDGGTLSVFSIFNRGSSDLGVCIEAHLQIDYSPNWRKLP